VEYWLDDAAFEIVDSFVDDTSYIYESTDDSGWILRVIPVPKPKPVAEELKNARQAFEGMLGPAVVYSNATTIEGGTRRVDGFEGELHDRAADLKQRFAIWALEEKGNVAVFILMGDRRGCLPEAGAILASASFSPASSDSRNAPKGRMRRRARTVSFEIPLGWSWPRTLIFADENLDDVRLRVTSEEPANLDDSFIEQELPSDSDSERKILEDRKAPAPAPLGGGSRSLRIWRRSPRGEETIELRKASLVVTVETTLTIYGQAPTARVDALNAGWDGVLRTVRARP
jgi:hypothetical protein